MSPSGLECIWSEGGLGECPQKDPSWLSSHLLPRQARAQYIVFLIIHLFLVSEYSILPWQGTPTTGEDWLREDKTTNPAKQKTSTSSTWWETNKEAGLQRSREAEIASLEKQKAQKLKEVLRAALMSCIEDSNGSWKQVSLNPETLIVVPKQIFWD